MTSLTANSLFKECNVDVVLPSYDVVTITYFSSKTYGAKVIDLKHKISEAGSGLDPKRIRLLLNYVELEDSSNFTSDMLKPNEKLSVVYKMVGIDPTTTQFSYDGFIDRVVPEDGAVLVPVSSSIVVVTKANHCDHIIRIPSLLNRTLLNQVHDGNMVKQFKNNLRDAKLAGFQQWTDFNPVERLLLLEVKEGLDLERDQIRYDVSGVNDGYMNGDIYSWQRYTKVFPVECKYIISDDVEYTPDTVGSGNRAFGGNNPTLTTTATTGISNGTTTPFTKDNDIDPNPHGVRITMKPYGKLKYNTHYAVLFCNHVPTVPVLLSEAPWTAWTMGGTNEDKLFLFKTEKR
jgi:hypothetical protein